MNYYSKEEKVKHVIQLTKLLKNFQLQPETYEHIQIRIFICDKFKTVSLNWINNDYRLL